MVCCLFFDIELCLPRGVDDLFSDSYEGGSICRRCPGVTEYFDPPENPGPGPNFTEKVGPPTQKTS